ncbi:MAG TPA: hypothetical protein VMQ61_11900 [Thermoanaerobaculia bacterium]|nr:hypothetical protein [Thermoanaerobaculia bacterium]
MREILGKRIEFGGEPHRGWLPLGASTPSPTSKRIATLDLRVFSADGGFLLEWKSRDTDDSGDLWYSILDEALAAARESFRVAEADWTVPSSSPF